MVVQNIGSRSRYKNVQQTRVYSPTPPRSNSVLLMIVQNIGARSRYKNVQPTRVFTRGSAHRFSCDLPSAMPSTLGKFPLTLRRHIFHLRSLALLQCKRILWGAESKCEGCSLQVHNPIQSRREEPQQPKSGEGKCRKRTRSLQSPRFHR